MEGKDFWQEFTQSGRVEDYLQYCSGQNCKRNCVTNEENSKKKDEKSHFSYVELPSHFKS